MSGLSSGDVGIKVNSRKVINDMMRSLGIPEEKWAATCVLVDKLEKVSLDDLSEDLLQLGLDKAVVAQLMTYVGSSSIQQLRALLGEDTEGLLDIERIFQLGE